MPCISNWSGSDVRDGRLDSVGGYREDMYRHDNASLVDAVGNPGVSVFNQ